MKSRDLAGIPVAACIIISIIIIALLLQSTQKKRQKKIAGVVCSHDSAKAARSPKSPSQQERKKMERAERGRKEASAASGGGSISAPLLDSVAQIQRKRRKESEGENGGATWAQTLGNIVVSIVGTGVLGLPYAFRVAGWAAGSMGVAVAGVATIYCMLLLVSSSFFDFNFDSNFKLGNKSNRWQTCGLLSLFDQA